MENIIISDITMRKAQISGKNQMTFRETLELSKLLDSLNVSVIELCEIENQQVDSLRIKTIAGLVNNSTIAVPVSLFPLNTKTVWDALSKAKKARLQVVSPVSTVQMEYLFHKKPDAILNAVCDAIKDCKTYTDDVEFVAVDATRSDNSFLYNIISSAISAGAKTVTVCDTAGEMLPNEFSMFIEDIYKNVPELKNVNLGISCSNELALADACAVSAVKCGAREIKTASLPLNVISLKNIATLFSRREDFCDVHCDIKCTELKKRISQINDLCGSAKEKTTPFENGVQDNKVYLTCHDTKTDVIHIAESLGYDLSKEDSDKVWNAFTDISNHKDKISSRELEAIIASNAMQVPSAYHLESYVITSSNTHGSTAHIKMNCHGESLQGISIGDGPIDAAYLAIEQITGCHYELDDFQISSVTEGREAMGETITKLRYNGKIYSGRGISTDITESGIHAYINALNKIVYEEETV